MWAATTDLVVELVLQNAGVGVVPRYLVDSHITRDRLRIVSTEKPQLTDSIWLNELADSQHAAAGRVFREAAIAELSESSSRAR